MQIKFGDHRSNAVPELADQNARFALLINPAAIGQTASKKNHHP